MEERLIFSVDDYGRAVARLMQADGQAVGAGFLIAPSYVMTCAHVVLQALGHEDFESPEHQKPPAEPVRLDFPLASLGSQPILARVVEWWPYSDNRDDIAVLKLETELPVGLRPIPFKSIEFDGCRGHAFKVYGFPIQPGDWNHSYEPEGPVDDGRVLLKKTNNSEIDAIESGYSGAPLWNVAKGCVVGMVATVQIEDNRKAYAIGWIKLEKILKRVSALDLHDTLQQSLATCSEVERYALERAISATLRRCHPNGGDRAWETQLIELSTDLPPRLGWEATHPLTYFAVMLAWMEDTPEHSFDRLKIWVEDRGDDFDKWLGRLTGEMKKQKVTASNDCEHLLAVVDRVEGKQHELVLTLWKVPHAKDYDPNRPSPPLVQEQSCSLEALPQIIRKTVRDQLGRVRPLIHLFLPRSLFDKGIEMLPSGQRSLLGSEYPCILRTNPSSCPHISVQFYQDDWHEKWTTFWEAGEQVALETFQEVDCQQPEDAVFAALEGIHAALLKNCAEVGEWLDMISEEWALPVALWSRDPQYQDQLEVVLSGKVKALVDDILQARTVAHRERNTETLSHHLSLVLEDPQLLPPDIQYTQEAC